jgi:hypothetical protein
MKSSTSSIHFKCTSRMVQMVNLEITTNTGVGKAWLEAMRILCFSLFPINLC